MTAGVQIRRGNGCQQDVQASAGFVQTIDVGQHDMVFGRSGRQRIDGDLQTIDTGTGSHGQGVGDQFDVSTADDAANMTGSIQSDIADRRIAGRGDRQFADRIDYQRTIAVLRQEQTSRCMAD